MKKIIVLAIVLLLALSYGVSADGVLYTFDDGTTLNSYGSENLTNYTTWTPTVREYGVTSSVSFGSGMSSWFTSYPAWSGGSYEIGMTVGNTRMWSDRRGRFNTSVVIY